MACAVAHQVLSLWRQCYRDARLLETGWAADSHAAVALIHALDFGQRHKGAPHEDDGTLTFSSADGTSALDLSFSTATSSTIESAYCRHKKRHDRCHRCHRRGHCDSTLSSLDSGSGHRSATAAMPVTISLLNGLCVRSPLAAATGTYTAERIPSRPGRCKGTRDERDALGDDDDDDDDDNKEASSQRVWVHLYRACVPDLPGAHGRRSSAQVYVKALEAAGLDVAASACLFTGLCWPLGPGAEAQVRVITHQNVGLEPIEFARRTLVALCAAERAVRRRTDRARRLTDAALHQLDNEIDRLRCRLRKTCAGVAPASAPRRSHPARHTGHRDVQENCEYDCDNTDGDHGNEDPNVSGDDEDGSDGGDCCDGGSSVCETETRSYRTSATPIYSDYRTATTASRSSSSNRPDACVRPHRDARDRKEQEDVHGSVATRSNRGTNTVETFYTTATGTTGAATTTAAAGTTKRGSPTASTRKEPRCVRRDVLCTPGDVATDPTPQSAPCRAPHGRRPDHHHHHDGHRHIVEDAPPYISRSSKDDPVPTRSKGRESQPDGPFFLSDEQGVSTASERRRRRRRDHQQRQVVETPSSSASKPSTRTTRERVKVTPSRTDDRIWCNAHHRWECADISCAASSTSSSLSLSTGTTTHLDAASDDLPPSYEASCRPSNRPPTMGSVDPSFTATAESATHQSLSGCDPAQYKQRQYQQWLLRQSSPPSRTAPSSIDVTNSTVATEERSVSTSHTQTGRKHIDARHDLPVHGLFFSLASSDESSAPTLDPSRTFRESLGASEKSTQRSASSAKVPAVAAAMATSVSSLPSDVGTPVVIDQATLAQLLRLVQIESTASSAVRVCELDSRGARNDIVHSDAARTDRDDAQTQSMASRKRRDDESAASTAADKSVTNAKSVPVSVGMTVTSTTTDASCSDSECSACARYCSDDCCKDLSDAEQTHSDPTLASRVDTPGTLGAHGGTTAATATASDALLGPASASNVPADS